MTKLNSKKITNFYIIVIISSILPILYLNVPQITFKTLPEILFWVLLVFLSDIKTFRVKHYSDTQLTVSFAVQQTALVILGLQKTVWIVAIAIIFVEIYMKRKWYMALFNISQYLLSLTFSGLLFYLMKVTSSDIRLELPSDLLAFLCLITVYYFLNNLFISVVISLTTGNKLTTIFFSDFGVITSYYLSMATVTISTCLNYRFDRPYTVFLMLPLLLISDQSLRRYYKLQIETEKTLSVLASTIDERDSYTAIHSTQVATYSKKIALAMNLNANDINDIEMAGRVHDLGKVGVEDSILFKSTPLTSEEYKKIQQHPETAYRVISNLSPYQKGAQYVLHHHERYDGKGYPKGLSGVEIPLGARILTVADSYDAMTTDRPYRKALTCEVALYELKKCAGSQFDPEIVQIFEKVLSDEIQSQTDGGH